MYLYLVQHAKAKSEEEDQARPLSEEGYRDIRKVALFLSKANLSIDSIWHSGKLRAKQTADVLAETLGVRDIKEVKGVAPLDEPEIIAEEILNSKSSIMIVGHLPHLSKLTSLLVLGDKERKVVNFQMGGVVCLKREEQTWSLRWFIIPEILSDL
ncbi:MAG: phosphohistidine phosphatase SixA [Thermodesulfovibrio sp.]|nr:phosphohistidine phosphatase SixA [Thermodesulfovibrio sp.]MDW7972129.1 phosphohistidine phosphatase SixA [Thermodesulfovibrio sp.]